MEEYSKELLLERNLGYKIEKLLGLSQEEFEQLGISPRVPIAEFSVEFSDGHSINIVLNTSDSEVFVSSYLADSNGVFVDMEEDSYEILGMYTFESDDNTYSLEIGINYGDELNEGIDIDLLAL